jgi:type I restriction enzyme S subunit
MPRDLVDGGIRRESLSKVRETKARELSKYRLEKGDLVVARRGEIGRCALVGAAEVGWVCGTGCLRVRLGHRILPSYLLQYFRWEETVGWLRENSVGQTMANLNTYILGKVPVWVPTLDVQRGVTRIMSLVDESVRVHRRLAALEGRLQAALLRDLLSKNDHAATLPKGWHRRPLGELCQLVNGYRFQAEEWTDVGLPIVRIQNLHGGHNFKYFSGYPKAQWRVEPGDLLFAWSGSRDGLGPTLWKGPQGVLNQHIFRVIPEDGVDQRWLFEVLLSSVQDLKTKAQGFKETLVHFRKRDLMSYPVLVPPPQDQAHIAQWSREMEERKDRQNAYVDLLLRLEGALRDDLFSGRKSAKDFL